jgi:hypothetical protein
MNGPKVRLGYDKLNRAKLDEEKTIQKGNDTQATTKDGLTFIKISSEVHMFDMKSNRKSIGNSSICITLN